MGHAQPLLSVDAGVELRWPTTAGNTYQLQWSPNPGDAGPWTDLGEVIEGTGESALHYDRVTGGVRHYRVVEVVPGSDPVSLLPLNGGFESGSGSSADSWNTGAGQPPVRSSADAHSGSFSMHSVLNNVGGAPSEGLLNQSVADGGGAIVGGQTYAFSFWARQVNSGASYIQQYQMQWLDGGGGVVGGTGLVNFNGGNGSWTEIAVPGLAAPATATGARISFRFVTGAVVGGSGEVFIDDVAIRNDSNPGPVGPGQTNAFSIANLAVVRIQWPTTPGIQYQAASTDVLASGVWSDIPPLIVGHGGTHAITLPRTGSPRFFRVESPEAFLLPPTNLRTIPSGLTNAIGLAWQASPTVEVLGYRVLHGTDSADLEHGMDVGKVTSATVSGLAPGQTYYLAVVAYTSDEESDPADALISAVPDQVPVVIALFDDTTPLEPATTLDTPTALITRVGDRGRGRHAREDGIRGVQAGPLYDVYLTFYWEGRVVSIEIVDRVAKGGTEITVNITSSFPLGTRDFRAFFRGLNTVAEYHHNVGATEIGPNQYTTTFSHNPKEGRAIQAGDRMEFEFSPFLDAPPNGRANYYGTAFLYIVGEGLVPWQGVGGLLDSFPLPETAWLGGGTTLHYQYSKEPQHLFKQMAGNLAPTNAQPFMLGRRLHHTDFGDGAHSEGGNPVFTEHVGKLGTKFINRSCVACHVHNGRALTPDVGASMFRTVMRVGSDASGSPHPVLGSVLQPQSASGTVEGSATIAGYTTINGQYGDGTPYALRTPNYAFPGVAPTNFSARLAPQLVGLGLLEAVSETTLLALADPDDADTDGVSGRAQTVMDPETGQARLGRFGYKAGQARLRHQVAAALNTDMGVTTEIFPVLDGDAAGGIPELNAIEIDYLTRYLAVLGVRARRDLADPQVLRGEALFTSAECVKCHVGTLVTSPFHPMTELRNQTIHPYTDLLLHDMGPGLADTMGEHAAAGSEWRTSPLWSIGHTAGVSGGEAYLHDGRARTLEEAILWHGGEAEASKETFRIMPASDRAALIRFLQSL